MSLLRRDRDLSELNTHAKTQGDGAGVRSCAQFAAALTRCWKENNSKKCTSVGRLTNEKYKKQYSSILLLRLFCGLLYFASKINLILFSSRANDFLLFSFKSSKTHGVHQVKNRNVHTISSKLSNHLQFFATVQICVKIFS